MWGKPSCGGHLVMTWGWSSCNKCRVAILWWPFCDDGGSHLMVAILWWCGVAILWWHEASILWPCGGQPSCDNVEATILWCKDIRVNLHITSLLYRTVVSKPRLVSHMQLFDTLSVALPQNNMYRCIHTVQLNGPCAEVSFQPGQVYFEKVALGHSRDQRATCGSRAEVCQPLI